MTDAPEVPAGEGEEVVVEAVAPTGVPDVAVVGAVASMEEALQMNQMRFILMWAMRLESVAREPGQV